MPHRPGPLKRCVLSGQIPHALTAKDCAPNDPISCQRFTTPRTPDRNIASYQRVGYQRAARLSLLVLRLIRLAVLDHAKGLALWFQSARKRVMVRSRWATLAKLPLRIACWLMSPNQRSTRLSHEALVGVKCR